MGLISKANWTGRSETRMACCPPPPHDGSGHTWHHDRDLLFAITKYGVAEAANLENYPSAMPALGNVLDDGEIEAVIDWIAST
jgi:hypothetical protein